MNPSAYAALLKLAEDETLGATLPTDVPVDITSAAALVDEEPSAEAVPDVVAPPAAPVAPPAAPAVKPLRTVADKYGVELSDATPEPRTPNASKLAAGLSRASTTLGSAIAGVRPNYSFSDGMRKDGANEAAALDKSHDDLTNFKQQLMLRVAQDKSKGAPELEDPMSSEYKQLEAMYMSEPHTRKLLTEYQARAREMGVTPSMNAFVKQVKLNQGMAQGGATERSEAGIAARNTGREDSQAHAKEMAEVGVQNSFKKLSFADALKEMGEVRHAQVPDMPIRAGASPTTQDGEQVKANNYKTAAVSDGLDALMNYVRANPDAIDKLNPFGDEKSELSVLYGKVRDAYRVAAQFGVPSGKDMEMIADVVKDPRRFLNVFSGRDMAAFEALKGATLRERDLFARTRGYDPSGASTGAPKAANPKSPMEIVRERLAPPVAAKQLTPPQPGMVRVEDPVSKKRGWFMPNAIPPGAVEVNDGR